MLAFIGGLLLLAAAFTVTLFGLNLFDKIAGLERRIENMEAVAEADWFNEVKNIYSTELSDRLELAEKIVANGILTLDFRFVAGTEVIYTCKMGKDELVLTKGEYGFSAEWHYYAELNGAFCGNAEELFVLAERLYNLR